MTANVPCNFIARSMRAAGDSAAVHAAACSASSYLVDVAQLRRVAASSTRSRLGGGMCGRQPHAGAGVELVDVNGGHQPESASLPRLAARRAVSAQRKAI